MRPQADPDTQGGGQSPDHRAVRRLHGEDATHPSLQLPEYRKLVSCVSSDPSWRRGWLNLVQLSKTAWSSNFSAYCDYVRATAPLGCPSAGAFASIYFFR